MLIAHIERGQCTRIGSKDLVMLRETKLDFHRELEKRSDEPVKGSFVNYMSTIHVPEWFDAVEAPSGETPGVLSESDFPGLPRREHQTHEKHEPRVPVRHKLKVPQKQEPRPSNMQQTKAPTNSLAKKWNTVLLQKQQKTDSASDKTMAETDDGESWLIDVSPDQQLAAKWQTAVQDREPDSEKDKAPLPTSTTPSVAKWQGAWGAKDIQAAIAKDREKRRVAPAVKQPAAATQPAPISDSMDLDDPEHPYFNASSYLSTVINKYVCPKLGCG